MDKEKRKKQVNESVRALRQAHRDAGEVWRNRSAHPDDWLRIDKVIESLRQKRGTIINRPIFKKYGDS